MAAPNPDPVPRPSSPGLSNESYSFLQKYIHQQSGIVIEPGKQYLLEARLMPIARREQLTTLNDLCALLRATQSGPLQRDVIEAMTTNETLFFRDQAPFEALRHTLLPSLIEERKATRTLSFWSAAASTGQEAYSIAMLLLEMGLRDWNIHILGTDISEHALSRAREGRYLQIEVNRGLPAHCLVKYFNRDGLEWRIKDALRRMVRFERFDLRLPMSLFGPFDFVFCRNVLIYFDVETKKKVLGQILGTLHPGGHLLLGAAETTLNLDDRFARRPVGSAIFYQAP